MAQGDWLSFTGLKKEVDSLFLALSRFGRVPGDPADSQFGLCSFSQDPQERKQKRLSALLGTAANRLEVLILDGPRQLQGMGAYISLSEAGGFCFARSPTSLATWELALPEKGRLKFGAGIENLTAR